MSATLAALNIADELFKTKARLEELESQAKDPMEKYDDVIAELEKSKTIIKALEIECESYKDQLLKIKMELEDAVNERAKYNEALELKEKELSESQNDKILTGQDI